MTMMMIVVLFNPDFSVGDDSRNSFPPNENRAQEEEKPGAEVERDFGDRLESLESLRPGLLKRKRSQHGFAVKEDKRGSRMKSFRSDLGKRRLDLLLIRPTNKKFDLIVKDKDNADDNKEKADDNIDSHGTSIGGCTESLVGRGERERQVRLEEDGGSDGKTTELQKRVRSSFRSDLGRRSADPAEEENPERRAGCGFRDDLGRKSSGSVLGGLDDKEKRRVAFRSDLGRKRSEAWIAGSNGVGIPPELSQRSGNDPDNGFEEVWFRKFQ